LPQNQKPLPWAKDVHSVLFLKTRHGPNNAYFWEALVQTISITKGKQGIQRRGGYADGCSCEKKAMGDEAPGKTGDELGKKQKGLKKKRNKVATTSWGKKFLEKLTPAKEERVLEQ